MAQFDDIEGLKELVPSQVNPNASTHSEENHVHSLLMCAAAHGSIECTKFLIKSGANVEQKNFMGFTALHWTAFTGRIECVDILLNSGADINAKTEDGKTVMHIAASRGHISYIEYILERGADLDAVNSAGWTAIFLAVVANQKATAKYLLEKGIEYDYFDANLKKLTNIATKYNRNWLFGLLDNKSEHKFETDQIDSKILISNQESNSEQLNPMPSPKQPKVRKTIKIIKDANEDIVNDSSSETSESEENLEYTSPKKPIRKPSKKPKQ
ncbi:ankyrin repeat domain-containing protein [Histomonas meleagridis]|uniref:ankyrin repeat domain-containing protein n=1 Tax=Histomonas meleagridis TaxID=135588 RepID=UPI00355A3191|nr:ankyrin repeat domain-containing protein [Histomonas meleagridis]KAH0801008.1 ankyrin repeat domain-containing protein [Histomonas meleagridis]